MTLFLAQSAGLLDLSLSFLVEVIAFLVMIGLLGWLVYPRVIEAAAARQRMISDQLERAERARQEAEQRLEDAAKQLHDARNQASQIVDGAGRSAEQVRAEIRKRADEEAKRVTENARRDIEAERQKAIDSVRGEVADLVVAATEKVVGETLDDERHRKLIEQAIAQVGDSRN